MVLVYGGGFAVGALVAWPGALARRCIGDLLLGNVVMLLIPFAAFLMISSYTIRLIDRRP